MLKLLLVIAIGASLGAWQRGLHVAGSLAMTVAGLVSLQLIDTR
jgi:hypothetical protein